MNKSFCLILLGLCLLNVKALPLQENKIAGKY